jgi:hypothetical protein
MAQRLPFGLGCLLVLFGVVKHALRAARQIDGLLALFERDNRQFGLQAQAVGFVQNHFALER